MEGTFPGKPMGPIPPTAPTMLSSFWGSCFQQEWQLQRSFTDCTPHPSDTAFEATTLVHPLHPICVRNSQRLQASLGSTVEMRCRLQTQGFLLC